MRALGPRPLVAAVVPGLIVTAVFHLWLGLDVLVAALAGVLWALGSLLVTWLLYDDAEEELAAFRDSAPELAAVAAIRLDPSRDVSSATPMDEQP